MMPRTKPKAPTPEVMEELPTLQLRPGNPFKTEERPTLQLRPGNPIKKARKSDKKPDKKGVKRAWGSGKTELEHL